MKSLILSIASCSLLLSSPAFSLTILDQEMSEEDQKKSGLSKLSQDEQKNLEGWLSERFDQKSQTQKKPPFGHDLYVSEIINGGQQLRLSNNTLYEIAPEDWVHAQAWITFTQVQVTHTGNEYYPFKITNPSSEYTVRARLVEAKRPESKVTDPELEELLKEEETFKQSLPEKAPQTPESQGASSERS